MCARACVRACVYVFLPPYSPAMGILKGYDQLLNLVLDGTVECLQGNHG